MSFIQRVAKGDKGVGNLLGKNTRQPARQKAPEQQQEVLIDQNMLQIIQEQLMNQRAIDPQLIYLADQSRNNLNRVSVSLPQNQGAGFVSSFQQHPGQNNRLYVRSNLPSKRKAAILEPQTAMDVTSFAPYGSLILPMRSRNSENTTQHF